MVYIVLHSTGYHPTETYSFLQAGTGYSKTISVRLVNTSGRGISFMICYQYNRFCFPLVWNNVTGARHEFVRY